MQSVVVASHAAGTPIDGFFVRKQAKGTGPKTQVEGVIAPDTHVVLVEDVTTQGKSALKAVEVVRALGCTVDTLLTVVDRKRGAEATLAEHGIRLVPVLSADQLGIAE